LLWQQLNQFFEGQSRESVKVGILSGDVQLNNVSIRHQIVDLDLHKELRLEVSPN